MELEKKIRNGTYLRRDWKIEQRNTEIRLACELVTRESYVPLLQHRERRQARLFQQFGKIAILASPLSFLSRKTTKCAPWHLNLPLLRASF
jgi:hypothetical protein